MRFFIKNGFGLVEIVVAVGLISISLIGLMTTAQVSMRIMGETTNRIQANFLLEEGIEAMKVLRDEDWTDNIAPLDSDSTSTTYYLSFSGSIWELSTDSNDGIVDTIFTRSIIVEDTCRDSGTKDIIPCGADIDPDIRKVTVTVSWPSHQGVETKTLSTYITNMFAT